MLPIYRNTCSWGLGLAETFRNTSKKLFNKYGSNLQNPSDRICRIYIPDEGKVFVQADQAGAEALIVAYLCREGNLRKLFKLGIKVHIFVALHLFLQHWVSMGHVVALAAVKVPVEKLSALPGWKELYEAIKYHSRYYFIGKKTTHASNYGMGPKTFREQVLVESENKIVISPAEAKLFLEKFHEIFPEVHEWHSEVDETLKREQPYSILRNLFVILEPFNLIF